jgi:GAF domain-containing protein
MVSADRRIQLWSLVVEQARGSPVTVGDVGAVVIAVSDVDATAVAVTLAASPREVVHASDQVADEIEELTTTLGEGPGVEALVDGPALAADLDDPASRARWPIFAPAAVALGVRAVFALPLQVGGIHLGVLDLYRGAPGALSRESFADVLVLADTACALLLDAGTVAGNGRRPEEAGLQHPEVHQATGMMVAQIGVSAAVALVRLRAYAYAHDQRLRDVATDVVARRLRFPYDTTAVTDRGDHDGA